MEKVNKGFFYGLLASELIHIFCCGLPLLLGVFSLMAGFGLAVTLPISIDHLHDFLHVYEVPMIMISGLILCMGWGIYYFSKKYHQPQQCHHTQCNKNKPYQTGKAMVIASLLFLINLTVYIGFHRDENYSQRNSVYAMTDNHGHELAHAHAH